MKKSIILGKNKGTLMKLLYSLQLLMLAVILPQAILAGPPIEAVIQQMLHRPNCAQTFIRSAQKQYPYSPRISAKNPTFTLMIPTLLAAIEHLHKVPGFENKLHIILRTLHLQTSGEFYEIEKALQIALSKNNIYAFEMIEDMDPQIRIFQDEKPTYFDLRTKYRIIECKDINWNDNPKENSPQTLKLRSQFMRQQKTVFLLNQQCNTSYLYEVHSKRVVPEAWAAWFLANGISVVDGKN
jgi:hypothetical protein